MGKVPAPVPEKDAAGSAIARSSPQCDPTFSISARQSLTARSGPLPWKGRLPGGFACGSGRAQAVGSQALSSCGVSGPALFRAGGAHPRALRRRAWSAPACDAESGAHAPATSRSRPCARAFPSLESGMDAPAARLRQQKLAHLRQPFGAHPGHGYGDPARPALHVPRRAVRRPGRIPQPIPIGRLAPCRPQCRAALTAWGSSPTAARTTAYSSRSPRHSPPPKRGPAAGGEAGLSPGESTGRDPSGQGRPSCGLPPPPAGYT